MEKKDREEFKKSLKVIQGGKLSKKQTRINVTKQLEELKAELLKVKDYRYSKIEEVKKSILLYEEQYGLYLENIGQNDMETWDKMNENISKLLITVKEAQIMQKEEKKQKRKKLGFEIVD